MKQKVKMFKVIIGIALCIVMAGCTAPKVDITVSEDGSKVEIHSEADGKKVDIKVDGEKTIVLVEDGNKTATIKVNDSIDEKVFGDLLYPGAKVKDGGSVEGMGGEAGTMAGAIFLTGDSVDKVSDYYKKTMKDAMVIDQRAADGVITYMKHEATKVSTVAIKKSDDEKGKTEIIISIVEQ